LLVAVAIVWAFDGLLGVALVASHFLWTGNLTIMEFSPVAIGATTILSNGFCFAVTWFFVCRKYRKAFKEGFGLISLGAKPVATSLAIGIVGAAIAIGLMARYGGKDTFMAHVASTRRGFIVLAIMAVFVPPFEEIYYRGFVFPGLRKLIGPWWSVTAVSLWFGLCHAVQLAGDWVDMLVVLGMGTLFTLQRQWYGSLVPSIVCHWTYNTCLVAASLLWAEF
jgi:membrane protease YdiL (CAAX protease family)